ncbi:hypothetical protein [Candidatus Minimicrobia naudis]
MSLYWGKISLIDLVLRREASESLMKWMRDQYVENGKRIFLLS